MGEGSNGAVPRLVALALCVFGVPLMPSHGAEPGAESAGTIIINAHGAPKSTDFTAQLHECLAYLSADPIVDDVLSFGTRIEIRHTGGATRMQFHPDDQSAVVFFNPRLGIRVNGRRIQSPALVLAHELGHIHRVLSGIGSIRNGRFTPAEELALINGIEARVALSIGEPRRRAWTGSPVVVKDVTLGRLIDRATRVSRASPNTKPALTIRPEGTDMKKPPRGGFPSDQPDLISTG